MEKIDPSALRTLLEQHRLWVHGEPSGVRLELRDVSLAGVELESAVLSRALLTNVNFSGAQLRHAGFSGARLEHVDFAGAKLEGACFADAQLSSCALQSAQLGPAFAADEDPEDEDAGLAADFQNARLSNVTFAQSTLQRTDFSDAHLEVVTFDGASMQRSVFVAARVTDGSFVGAHMEHANLAKSSFSNVTLRDARLAHARLRRWTCAGRTELRGADLTAADLGHATFATLDLRGANLSDAKLWNTRIRTACVHATHGLPFLFDVAGDAVWDFSADCAASDAGDVLRLARQLGDESGCARFGDGAVLAHYRGRSNAAGADQLVIESIRGARLEAIRVTCVKLTQEDEQPTLRVEYELLDARFRDWDMLAHALIFEHALKQHLRDKHRGVAESIHYVNLDGGERYTDYAPPMDEID